MNSSLNITIGQFTTAGVKPENQDSLNFHIPKAPLLSEKGIALALADGISSSSVSKEASEAAVSSFLNDYYCTADSWTVQTAGKRVLLAINSWLHSQSRQSRLQYDRDKGYVCTFSALIFKDHQAHLFHVGDSRIYRVFESGLEQLTKDHRLIISSTESYLAKALGADSYVDIDYQSYQIKPGDIYLLMTDGVYEHMDTQAVLEILNNPNINSTAAAQTIVETALARGSKDNLTLQIARVEQVASSQISEIQDQVAELPLPPELEARQEFDGYRILRQIYRSSRSQVYLAEDNDSGKKVVIKTPTLGMSADPQYLERFLMEEWIARRINNAHVVKVGLPTRRRQYLYTVSEYVEGQTLDQWITDNPKPQLSEVRTILKQISLGLRAFHRMEMLHQDIKPENIIIDKSGTVKIIDFGSTRVLGISESDLTIDQPALLGTAIYAAPEYFLGEYGSFASDQYSLGVLAYHMLSGRYPYGTNVPKATTRNAQRRLTYKSLLHDDSDTPLWIDEAIKRATQILPHKRYPEISEFIHDLSHPNKQYLNKTRPPLMERDPVRFWQFVSLALAVSLIAILATP